MKQFYVCVAPSGNLELWWHDENSYWGSELWNLSDGKPDSSDISEIEEDPAFWGREIIDSWAEMETP